MELTPMQKQYMEIKQKHPKEILFFRLGDFYEMFFEDAAVVSRELGLTLTSRSGDVNKNPMCGVPYHAVDGYLAKLVAKGYRVAIAEAMYCAVFSAVLFVMAVCWASRISSWRVL